MSQDKRRTKMKKEIFKKYRHALWALYLPIYLIAFFMLEHYIGWDADYWVSYTPLDDVIPFCEYFVIFYYLWYPFMGAVGIWLIFEDGDKFRRYMWFIAIGFSASVVFMALFPNGQNLRPESFAHDNIFTRMVGAMYKIDTNTNVLPSLHVVGAFAAYFGLCDSRLGKKVWLNISGLVLALLITASTVFIKQHSMLDVYAGFAVAAVLYVLVYVVIKRAQKKHREKQLAAKNNISEVGI